MQEDVTLVQAARLIGVTPRILTAWLKDAGITTRTGKDKRAQYLTQPQVRMLAAAHGRVLPDDVSLAALAGQLQALQGELDAVKRRVADLEQKKIHAASGFPQSIMEERPGAMLPKLRAAFDPDPVRRAAYRADALRKSEVVRLVSARHGVEANTAKGWPWPQEALVSEEAALRWALAYVARMDSFRRPRSWRWRCEIESCPCHQTEP